jgi:hypothetical protein
VNYFVPERIKKIFPGAVCRIDSFGELILQGAADCGKLSPFSALYMHLARIATGEGGKEKGRESVHPIIVGFAYCNYHHNPRTINRGISKRIKVANELSLEYLFGASEQPPPLVLPPPPPPPPSSLTVTTTVSLAAISPSSASRRRR